MAKTWKLTYHRKAALTTYAEKVARGIDSGLDSMEAIAIAKAPVSKDNESPGAGTHTRGELIRPIPLTRFKARNAKDKDFQRNLIGFSARERVVNFRHGESVLPKAGFINARRFEFTGGENKGKQPGRIKEGRGTLLGVATHRGGNLKSKIHRTRVERNGKKVRGSVRSEANYSKPVEYGFFNVWAQRRLPAQSFMRPAKADFVANWRSHFKG